MSNGRGGTHFDSDEDDEYRSPTLTEIGEPGGDVACIHCPVALWYEKTNGEVTCFCSALHKDSWSDNDEHYIRRCDAREQALAKYAGRAR